MSSDPYVYEGTDTLRNNAGIRDPEALTEREQIVSFQALRQMLKEPVLGNFDQAHFAAIHKRLFAEVYPWAGETRTIELWKPEIVLQGKSVAYTPPAGIEQQMRTALASLVQEQPGNLKESRPAMRLAQNMATLFQAHPFREGNTCTLLAFMEQYARHHQQPLDQALINRVPSETRDALVLATRGQIRPLSEMVRNARYSEEQRAHPVLGRLSAEAFEATRLMGAPRIVLPEPGTQIRRQVVATSYHHALVRQDREIAAVPLSSFRVMPENNSRVDVRVLRNDEGLRLFNGDIGLALPQPGASDGALRVVFPSATHPGGFRSVSPARLSELDTAFAMTVHKSQGSEFDGVLVLLPAQAGALCTRELLYTAVTRARRRVTLAAGLPVLQAATRSPTRRQGGFAVRLREAMQAIEGRGD